MFLWCSTRGVSASVSLFPRRLVALRESLSPRPSVSILLACAAVNVPPVKAAPQSAGHARMMESAKHGTRQQAHPGIKTARRHLHRHRDGMRRLAGMPSEENRRAYTRAPSLVRTRLVVEVEDKIWQRQLFALSPHILRNLERAWGRDWWTISNSEWSRRGESRNALTQSPAAAPLFDEADAIADPVLRGIYRGLAQKGTGVKITEKEVRYVAGSCQSEPYRCRSCQVSARPRRHPRAHGQAERDRHRPVSSRWRKCSFDAEETATLRADVE